VRTNRNTVFFETFGLFYMYSVTGYI